MSIRWIYGAIIGSLVASWAFGQQPLPFGNSPRPPFGPPQQETIKIVKQFDNDKNGWLNAEERAAARKFLEKERVSNLMGRRGRLPGGFGPPPPGGPGGMGRIEPGKPGPSVQPHEVPHYPDKGLYDPKVLRTIFLEFESDDWENELQAFHGTDVEVPATLIVDGKKYPLVGVRFRGMTSYMTVPPGLKRSLNLSLDLTDKNQRLDGHKTLNLLNAHQDPSMMSTVIYSHIARQYLPCPRANFVKVVINGESWGVYVNLEQFNKDFTRENFHSEKGARWKVTGSPQADGGLRYVGDNIEEYKRRYEIKTKDDPTSWKALIELCRVLDRTPLDQLEAALSPILAIDEVLWFLAVDITLCNSDGYWTRASDYCLYRDESGKFHIIPHDFNEAFRGTMLEGGGRRGPGFGPPGVSAGDPRVPLPSNRPIEPRLIPGKVETSQMPRAPADRPVGRRPGNAGPGGTFPNGADLDPLFGLNNPRTPLRSRMLAVPALRQKYLENIRTISEQSLAWETLGPVIAEYRRLIEKEVAADTRKLMPLDAFQRAHGIGERESQSGGSLRQFIEQRRQYLLNHPQIKELVRSVRPAP
jgi:spore coat protein CotH